MRRFRALIKKEITHMLRDPRTLVFIFLMPILQLALLGYATNTDIKNVPTVVFNQDSSQASRALGSRQSQRTSPRSQVVIRAHQSRQK